MSKRRQTIARRLVEAQHTAAMLTTFNEVDMSAVMALRERKKESFKKEHGVGLGIASFFVKASIAALRAFPQINAELQGDEIVMKRYYDIGIAVGAEGGLVVPVLRDADRMSFPEIELAIRDFATRANDGTLTLEDLMGGTFTITNGGVFGSLLSTPILNPPQVAILGLHKIQDRAVAAERPGRDPPDDVRRPQLRSPHRRRPGSGTVPGADQGVRGRTGQPSAGELMRTFATIVALSCAVVACGRADACNGAAAGATAAPPDVAAVPADAAKTSSGLASRMITPGGGTAKVSPTDVVTVHYTAWTPDGKMFDSSKTRGTPSMFPLNRSLVGWRECVQLMTVGETRRCWLPENLAYQGQAGRPRGMVVFDIELIDTRPAPNVAPPDVKGPPDDAKRTASGLAYKVLKPGTGTRKPAQWDSVTVHYTGWTTDGKMFDSSRGARHARDAEARGRDQGLDRRHAAHGRGGAHAFLDSAEPRLQGRGRRATRHARLRYRSDQDQLTSTPTSLHEARHGYSRILP